MSRDEEDKSMTKSSWYQTKDAPREYADEADWARSAANYENILDVKSEIPRILNLHEELLCGKRLKA